MILGFCPDLPCVSCVGKRLLNLLGIFVTNGSVELGTSWEDKDDD